MEQQKQDINKLDQEIKTNQEVIKTLRGMQTITVSKATDKEQEIKEMRKRLEQENGVTTIMTKETIEMREKIKLMEEKIKVKQKHYENRGKESENMKIEIQKITKEIEKQKQNWDREKETQKIKEEKLKQKISLDKQVTELKAVNLRLERNQMTMTELRHQTKEQERTNVKDHINNRNESIEVVKIIVIDKEKKSIMEEEFQQQMNKINKIIRSIEIIKEPTGTNGNVAILTIAKTETVEKTIKEIINTGKQSANKIGNKTNLEHNRTNTNTDKRDDREESTNSHKQKEGTQCYACRSRDHKIKHCSKNCKIFVSYRGEEYLNDKELHDIAKEYGKIRKINIKTDRYGLEKSMQ